MLKWIETWVRVINIRLQVFGRCLLKPNHARERHYFHTTPHPKKNMQIKKQFTAALCAGNLNPGPAARPDAAR